MALQLGHSAGGLAKTWGCNRNYKIVPASFCVKECLFKTLADTSEKACRDVIRVDWGADTGGI